MATGYNILQPNGKVVKVKASTPQEREAVVKALLDEWGWYCEKNWVGVNTGPYSPENKVKSFLSSLSYFLIMGSTDDIVTDYKQVMNGKREIPVSSCPSFVEENMYSGCHANNNELAKKAETECFAGIVERADTKAKQRYGPSKKKAKDRVITKSEKLRAIRSEGVMLIPCVVDTENIFEYDGRSFRILSNRCPQYDPKKTKSGSLYDMDTIYVAVGKDGTMFGYYDGAINPIESCAIIEIPF